MDELTCELPPGYLAAVYETMTDWLDDDRFKRLPERLEELGWGLDDLREFAQRYAAAHEQLVTLGPGIYTLDDPSQADPRAVMSEEHASVASWLLVGELASQHRSYEFHLEVTTKAAKRGVAHKGGIICWVLGYPVLSWNIPPSVPALQHPDEAVVMAWQGLLWHLRQLDQNPTPEIPITSVVWRICALVDGMFESQNANRGLENKIGDARARMESVLEPGEYQALRSLVSGMVDKRNVLTHLRTEKGISFRNAVDAYREYDSVAEHVKGITVATFHTIAEEHADTRISLGIVRNVEATLPDLTATL